jgi:outer membrane lipoprotein-sorting protein
MSYCWILLGLAALNASLNDLAPLEVLRRAETSYAPDIFGAVMQLYTEKNGEEKLSFEFRVRGKKDAGVRLDFTGPAREKGKRILRKDDNIWFMTPGISKPMRIAKTGTFMGTGFSNNDIMDSRLTEHYDALPYGKGSSITDTAYILILNAKTSSVPYKKAKIWVRKSSFVVSRLEYYSSSDMLLKVLTIPTTKIFEGVVRPECIRTESTIDKSTAYEIRVLDMNRLPSLPGSIFNPQTLATSN